MSDIDDKDFVWITANKLFDDYKIKCDPKESVFNLPKSERLELLNFILKQTKPMKKTNAQLEKENAELKSENKRVVDCHQTTLSEKWKLQKEVSDLQKFKPVDIDLKPKSVHIDIVNICKECGVEHINFASIAEVRKVSLRFKTLFQEANALGE